MLTNQILCGEAANILSTFPEHSIDLVVTDPPYLCNYRDRSGRKIINDDNPQAVFEVYKSLYRVLKPHSYCVSFYGWTAIAGFANAWQEAGFRIIGHIVWPKAYSSRTGYMRYAHESAFVLAKGYPLKPDNPIPDVQPWAYTGNKAHPTQKAVSIITPLIESFSKPGDVVLDPFSGSGTTAIAAALTHRHYIGIEIEHSYCEIAQERLRQIEAGSSWDNAA